MNDRERITRLEIRCEQLQLTVNEAFRWIDILKSDLSDLQDRVGQTDRKTENSSENPNNCANCKHLKKHNGNLADWVCDRKGSIVTNPYDKECDEMWERKDEPQTDDIGVPWTDCQTALDEPQTERSNE